jgi:hypothetical protein
MNDKKYLQVIEWACQFREEAEATGRGTRFPTVQECAKRFRVAQKSILEAIDSGDHPKGYHCAYNVAIASGGGVGEWKQSEYEIEVWRNNPADLRFDQATADEFRAFWEAQGWRVREYAVVYGEAGSLCAYRETNSREAIGAHHLPAPGVAYLDMREAGEGPEEARGFGLPVTTFGEAIEILNELAETRAFGGWAKEEGSAEGS